MPKVSIILTSLNHEKYIREAIVSALNQTFTDFELIIWDDASSDGSWMVISSYSDPRIKAFRNETTKRAIYGLNKAISEVATGEYIAIHHSDDVWMFDKLEKQVAYLDSHSEIGAIFTLVQIIDENGTKLENDWFAQENKTQWQWLSQLFLEQNHLNHPSVLIRKQCYDEVGPYRYGLAQTGDAEMWSRVLLKFPIHVIQDKLTKHRLFSDKSNTSGDRVDVVIRVNSEWNVIRENYLEITSFANLVSIFPSLERYRNTEGCDIKFLLAMACLYECNQRNAWQLGLKWLFDILNDKILSEKIKELYSFSYLDFIKLTGEFDIYAFLSIKELTEANGWLNEQRLAWKNAATERDNQLANLNQELSDRDNQINNLNQALSDRESSLAENHQLTNELYHVCERLREAEAKIAELLSSTSWRITEPLRAVRRHLQRKTHPTKCFIEENSVTTHVTPIVVNSVKVQSNSLLDDSDFDAEFYRKAYPDTYGLDPYFHYSAYGKNEGRLPCAPEPVGIEGLEKLDRSNETVLIVSHEASRTGAPILALNIAQHFKEKKYNVIVFLLRGGDLLADFQEHCDIVIEPFPQSHNPYIVSIVLGKLISQSGLKFAIVNSIVSRPVLPALSNSFVPSLCLIHEFASYTSPKDAIREVVLWASQVVFSARIVYENNATQCEALKEYSPVILPQGKCVVPHIKETKKADEYENKRIRKLFRPDSLPDNTVVILGAGYVQLRKGVDLFLACAAQVVELCPKNNFRFVWVGHGFDPDLDLAYSAYLQDQIDRARLENHFCFSGELSNMDLVYELSDVLFLSSRLDPLPNVAIDAMFRQMPLICFDGTTGIADLLKENGFGASCVIPYLDVEKAAQRLVVLIEDADQRYLLGNELKEVGRKLFDMRSYIDSLERQAMDCVTMQESEKIECSVIEKDGALDLDFYSSPALFGRSYKEAVRAFVRSWKSSVNRRIPFPGFHPGIYEDCHGLSKKGLNPLADFIQAGKPEGPWMCELIQPFPPVQMRTEQPLRAALLINVFSADLFLNILERLDGQDLHLDLLVSVPSLEVAEEVGDLASGYMNGMTDIRTVLNRGYEIGSLLEFSDTIFKKYDVLGHVHIKKTRDVHDFTMEGTLSNFLLENLIGKTHPMAMTIVGRMLGNEKLGLVFPCNPEVVGWSGHKEIAESFAHQFDIKELPDHSFNFPVDNMFWARTEAIKPLLTKEFKWEDGDKELMANDSMGPPVFGRLLPFVAEKMGYQSLMTHLPGVTR